MKHSRMICQGSCGVEDSEERDNDEESGVGLHYDDLTSSIDVEWDDGIVMEKF